MDCFEALPLAMTNRERARNDEEGRDMDCFEALPLAMTKGGEWIATPDGSQ